MRVRLSEEYSGRQILDAFKVAIVAQNNKTILWETGERPASVLYELPSARSGELKTTVSVQGFAIPLRKEPSLAGIILLRPWSKMEAAEIYLSPLDEHGMYQEFDISIKNIQPENEGSIVGHELGILVYHLLLRIDHELKRPQLAAAV